MSQPTNDYLKGLQLANDYLKQARQQLIRCDSLTGQTEPTLLRVVALLQDLKANPERSKADGRRVAELLLEIRANTGRAQLLLDSAAAILCGAALAGPGVAETYAPDGAWQTIYPNDQICLNA